MAIEEPRFTLLREDGAIQIREYAPVVVAETEVQGDFERVSNEGFRRLAGYIFGGNRSRSTIAMTAPVSQSQSQKIAMTAPVGQVPGPGGGWLIRFTMPAEHRLDSLPVPDDDRVHLREIPAQRVAALRFSGSWSRRRFEAQRARLEQWLAEAGLEPAGEPTFARYNPPWVPWFLRRNEVLLPLK